MLADLWNWFSTLTGFVIALVFVIIAYYVLKMYIARRLMGKYIDKKIREYKSHNNHGSFRGSRTTQIVEAIIAQMGNGMLYSKASMVEHANFHGTVLFRTTVYLTDKLNDLSLYEAMAEVQAMFYATYGRWAGSKPRGLRNKLEMTLRTTTGQDLTRLIEFKSPEEAVRFINDAGYGEDESYNGCVINLTMSICTPVTKAGYDYSLYHA